LKINLFSKKISNNHSKNILNKNIEELLYPTKNTTKQLPHTSKNELNNNK
jgi:hypothetical protein